jgi:hypothetical protein
VPHDERHRLRRLRDPGGLVELVDVVEGLDRRRVVAEQREPVDDPVVALLGDLGCVPLDLARPCPVGALLHQGGQLLRDGLEVGDELRLPGLLVVDDLEALAVEPADGGQLAGGEAAVLQQLLPVGVAELQGCADLVAELLVRVGDRLEVGAGVEVAAGGRPDREHGAAGRHDLDAGDVDCLERQPRSRFGCWSAGAPDAALEVAVPELALLQVRDEDRRRHVIVPSSCSVTSCARGCRRDRSA